jgi:large subunit ribosomal protein L22
MKAVLRNYKQSPRKVRLVADLIRGKSIDNALTELSHLDKKSALPMRKLLESAVANAKENEKKENADLFVKEIRVDKGIVFKRFMPVWHGIAHPILRKRSNVSVILGSRNMKNKQENKKRKLADQK